MTRFLDLNADAGESPDPESDLPLLDFVTSVNIACGVHAGGPLTIARLSEEAARRGVGVGAHPGLVEGRKARIVSAGEAEDAVKAQVEEFRKHTKAPVQHVKLHGFLYHAAREPRIAKAVAGAVKSLGAPMLVAQAGSPLEKAGRDAGLRVAAEAFLDRAYEPDGKLVSREKPGALLESEEAVTGQALLIALERRVLANSGRSLPVEADTLCVHGDTPGAARLAKAARAALEKAGVVLRPMGAA